MTTLDLKLPRHLYRQTTNEDGEVTEVTYLHDRLMNWFDRGKGAQKFCQTEYENELEKIARWEDNQLLLLEEQWLAIENGEDDDASEARYHIACEAVAQEAGDRRAQAAREHDLRHDAISELVKDCAEHLEEHAPEPFTSHAAEYTLAIMLVGAVAFMML